MSLQKQLHSKSESPLLVILKAWLLAGTLDGSSAVVHYALLGAKHPEKIFQFISSGIFGKEAYTAGDQMIWLGILLHYLIALSFSIFFFLIYPKIKFLSRSRFLTASVYGIFVWVIMNLIVIPNSNIAKRPFDPLQSAIGLVILIVMIGLPLSFIIGNYYDKNSRAGAENN